MAVLAGKVAVVTGASKGIGAGIARRLAADGAAVVVNYATDRDGAERVVADITASGGRAIAVQASMAVAEDITRLFTTAAEAFGTLHILVNNAGVFAFGPLESVTPAEFHRQFDTNVLGLLLATQAAVAHFGEAGGSVVNIGSVASRTAPPGSAIYSATKGAVTTITHVLAKELAPRGIRVNSVNPGPTETEGTRTAGIVGSDFEKQMVASTPLGRLGQPEDIAAVVAFLASPQSGWITGEVLLASGGLR